MIKSKLKISLIGTNGIPAKYGGFETLAEYLSKYLSQDYELFCYCSKTPKENRQFTFQNTKLIYLPFKANGWQSLIYDSVSIIDSLFKHDILLVLGFSGAIAFPLKFLFRKKIIFNIGGVEWQKIRGNRITAKFEIFSKKAFEWICVKSSNLIIVDNQVLYDYVSAKYKVTPILAEYGGDHAVKGPINLEHFKKYTFLSGSYDLTISRAQENMNIHLVLNSYKSMPERKIVVISNWNTSDYGKKLKSKYLNKYQNIILLDAIYDLNVLNAIRGNCSVYLHTHSLCGTAPSLVEAMYMKLPIICFDVPTNRAATELKSYYFKDDKSLISLLRELNCKSAILLSENMYEIASRRYTWRRVVNIYKKCIDVYEKN